MLRPFVEHLESNRVFECEKSAERETIVRLDNTWKRRCLFSLVLLTAQIAVFRPTMAQESQPLSIKDALGTAEFGQLVPIALSPDGKWLAYTVKNNQKSRSVDFRTWIRSGIRGVFTGTDIWFVNTETGETRNLTGGVGDNFLPVWSADGRYLAFVSDRDGDGQLRLWIWDTTRNQLRKVSDLGVRQFGQVEWTADGKSVIVPVVPESLSLDAYVEKVTSASGSQAMTTDGRAPGSTVVLYQSGTSTSPSQDAVKSTVMNLDLRLRDLASIDLATGNASIIVHQRRIGTFMLSPDGSRLAYTVQKSFEKPSSQQILFDLVILTLSTNEERLAASDIRLDYDGAQFSWSPDSQHLAYRTFGSDEGTNDCFLVSLDGASPRNLTTLTTRTKGDNPRAPLWNADSGAIYFIRNGSLWRTSIGETKGVEVANVPNRDITHVVPRTPSFLWTTDGGASTVVVAHDDAGKQDGFYKIDLATGTSTKLLERGQCFTCMNVDNSGLTGPARNEKKIVYFAEDAQHEANLWMSDASFRNPQQLTRLNPQFDKYKMGEPRLISWLSDDGETLHGALLLPVGFQEGKRYPLLVWVYGGDSLSNHFNQFGFEGSGTFNMQLFATRGYAVLFPDAPLRLGTPMADLGKTVLPGINKVIEMGIADPERLGVMGQSFGGYSTLGLIVQTKRFKAAVEADGMGDLFGMYGEMTKSGTAFGTSVDEHGQGSMGGTPWEFRDRYAENSPVFYLNRSDTPLLIVHGSEDIAVAPFLGDELFVALRRLGKPVEYAKYEGEDHTQLFWSYANQVDFCNRVIAWFDKYLKS
jgi:dipeptidyl aminopeptidase/acylaminoacyl peptidase